MRRSRGGTSVGCAASARNFGNPSSPSATRAEKRSSNKEECYQVSVSEYYSSSKGYSHTRTWWHLSWHTDMPWGEIDL
jgi:hypothetical protein